MEDREMIAGVLGIVAFAALYNEVLLWKEMKKKNTLKDLSEGIDEVKNLADLTLVGKREYARLESSSEVVDRGARVLVNNIIPKVDDMTDKVEILVEAERNNRGVEIASQKDIEEIRNLMLEMRLEHKSHIDDLRSNFSKQIEANFVILEELEADLKRWSQ